MASHLFQMRSNIALFLHGRFASALPASLAVMLGLHLAGCANAKIGNVGQQKDSGVSEDAAGENGKDSGEPGKKDGPPGPDVKLGNCDPLANSGCGSGEKCTALQQSDKTLALGCDATGSKAEGEPCAQVMNGGAQSGDDCAASLACFNIGDGAGATCHRFCAYGAADTGCPDGELCSAKVQGLPDSLAFCRKVTTCAPLDQTGCASGQACYFSSTGAVCAKEGNGKPGDACSNANDCQRGGTCVSGRCASFCTTESGAAPSCTGADTGGDTCTSFGVASLGANLGYCVSS
jgi:hypothetical protein